MRVVRCIEYTGPEEDVKRHLDETLLSKQPVWWFGSLPPWTFRDARREDRVTIRLLEEETT